MQQVVTASSQALLEQAQSPALMLFIKSLGYLPGRRYYPDDKPERDFPDDDGFSGDGDY